MVAEVTPINKHEISRINSVIEDLKDKRAIVIVVDADNKVSIYPAPDTSNFEQAGWCLRAAGYFANS